MGCNVKVLIYNVMGENQYDRDVFEQYESQYGNTIFNIMGADE